MAPPHSKTVKQCKTCPWRVGCNPEQDIPGYMRELHERLGELTKSGPESLEADTWMACHYSPLDATHVCAGWLHHQINEGNHFGARVAVMTGRLPAPEVSGEQHASFNDTIRDRDGRAAYAAASSVAIDASSSTEDHR